MDGKRHQYYASSVMTGGAKTFSAIDFCTLEANDFGELDLPGSPIISDVEESDDKDTPRLAIMFDELEKLVICWN